MWRSRTRGAAFVRKYGSPGPGPPSAGRGLSPPLPPPEPPFFEQPSSPVPTTQNAIYDTIHQQSQSSHYPSFNLFNRTRKIHPTNSFHQQSWPMLISCSLAANLGFPERPLHPEEMLLIREQSLRSDSDIQAIYQSKLAIDTDSIRARLAFLLRVWDSVIDGKYQNEIRGAQDNRKYQEAFILATQIIPGRAAIGFSKLVTAKPSEEALFAPPSLDDDSDSSTYYSPNTPSRGSAAQAPGAFRCSCGYLSSCTNQIMSEKRNANKDEPGKTLD